MGGWGWGWGLGLGLGLGLGVGLGLGSVRLALHIRSCESCLSASAIASVSVQLVPSRLPSASFAVMRPTMSSMKTPVQSRGTGRPSRAITVGARSTISTWLGVGVGSALGLRLGVGEGV